MTVRFEPSADLHRSSSTEMGIRFCSDDIMVGRREERRESQRADERALFTSESGLFSIFAAS